MPDVKQILKEKAFRSGPFSNDEDLFLLREDIPLTQRAARLGRTLDSVKGRVTKLQQLAMSETEVVEQAKRETVDEYLERHSPARRKILFDYCSKNRDRVGMPALPRTKEEIQASRDVSKTPFQIAISLRRSMSSVETEWKHARKRHLWQKQRESGFVDTSLRGQFREAIGSVIEDKRVVEQVYEAIHQKGLVSYDCENMARTIEGRRGA